VIVEAAALAVENLRADRHVEDVESGAEDDGVDAVSSLPSLGIGLGIQRALDPSISAQLLADGLRMLLTLAGATFGAAMPGST
jgi:hypothetical protein